MEYTELKNTVSLMALISLTNPLELIKTRLQTTKELVSAGKLRENYKGVIDCLKKVFKNEGLKCFWKGNAITLFRFYPNESINFFTKSQLKPHLPDRFSYNVLTGILGGWTASAILYPFDTLRLCISNTIEGKANTIALSKEILRKNGTLFFYKGFCNSLLGTAIFRGAFNGLYDLSKKHANNTSERMLSAYLSTVFSSLIAYPLDTIRRRRITVNSQDNLTQFGIKILSKEGLRGLYGGSKIVWLQSLTGSLILYSFDSRITSSTA